ncbi:MAG: hypothetical protein AAB946_02895, partial [Patescibacteria group bacterium]
MAMQHILKTIELLANVVALKAEEAYEKIRPHIGMYLKAITITTLSWLLLILLFAVLKAVTGMILFGYLFAFTALAISLFLGLMWAPIGIAVGMLVEKTANPIDGGRKYIRFFAIAVFIGLFASMYIIRVPMHQNISAVPILVGSAIAVAIGSAIWGGFLSGRFYTFIAMVIMSLTTMSFFFPETFAEISKKFDGLDNAIAKAIREPRASIQKPDQIAPHAKQAIKPAPQRYSPPPAEKTQPIVQKDNGQAIRQEQANKVLVDAVRKARADSSRIALAREKSPQYIKAKLDSARAAQESLC